MKIRLTGTPQECADALARLYEVFEIREASTFRPNRGITKLGRVYVDVDPKPTQ
ncbi:hypothetical protein JOF53_002889 [Crossiella equi]|uniref:Uncharacterized protein n=1 Tax=Crossiella equi TaxID=130796 RepID=A0ABS5ACL3_9PSEU|nr:hypothetical protein [Crossiella equi]MBP2474017.1 hypothetical protein [Crossiella equi]